MLGFKTNYYSVYYNRNNVLHNSFYSWSKIVEKENLCPIVIPISNPDILLSDITELPPILYLHIKNVADKSKIDYVYCTNFSIIFPHTTHKFIYGNRRSFIFQFDGYFYSVRIESYFKSHKFYGYSCDCFFIPHPNFDITNRPHLFHIPQIIEKWLSHNGL